MQSVWQVPPQNLQLIPGQVYVFRMHLDAALDGGVDPAALLDAEEQARAQRFLFDVHRTRFINTHLQSRQILGWLLDSDPARLVFQKNEHGKPALSGSRLRFNISHSQNMGLIAVVLDREIGVDIEQVRPDVSHDAIAVRFFAPQEVKALQALPAQQQQEAFFLCWTRKEAYIKARGIGLKIPLRQFAVTIEPGQPARLLHPEPGAPAAWAMASLDPGPGFCGAVVVQEAFDQIQCWGWPAT